MSDSLDLKTLNTMCNSMWRLIKAHHFALDDSLNHWDIFFRACEDTISKFPQPYRDLLIDWLLSYSKFRDIQLNHSDDDSSTVPNFTKIGAERFLDKF